MPIYEYVCMECESHFEELVRGEQQVACPDCASPKVENCLTTFAAAQSGQTTCSSPRTSSSKRDSHDMQTYS